MHYYIDGYNLFFRLPRSGKNFTLQRNKLIIELVEKAKLLDLEVTIVFDGHCQLNDHSRSYFQPIKIIYTGFGETADECILAEVRGELHPQQVTVVTSDKKLAWFARRCSAKTESVEQFYDWLDKRCKNRLRQSKRSIAESQQPLMNTITTKKKGVKKPIASSTPEECLDYYKQQFEKNLQKMEQERAKTPQQKVAKENLKIPSEPLSEIERWRQLFEKKLKDLA